MPGSAASSFMSDADSDPIVTSSEKSQYGSIDDTAKGDSGSGKGDEQSGWSDPEFRSRWISLIIAFIVQFLLMLQNSIFFNSLWPFVSSIDETATETFYGVLAMSFSLAAAIASPLFGYWTNKIQQCRIPIIVGICITIVGNVLLATVEVFPSNRKWILLVARFISGFGCGNYGSLFAYVVMASKPEERSRAISIRASLNSVALILGPALQTAFVPIGYPGLVASGFHLDMYTTTGWVNVIAGIIQVCVMATLFKEFWVSVDKSQLSKPGDDGPKKVLRPYDKNALFASIWIRFAYQFFLNFDGTISSPFSMLMFNWSATEAVLYNGIIDIGISIIDLSGNLIMGNIVLKYVQERKTIIVGLFCALIGILIIFSWPGLPMLISAVSSVDGSIVNATAIPGTNATTQAPEPCDDYSWCSYTTRITFAQYLLGRMFIILSVSIGYTPNATIFSKVLGPRKQGTLQGMFAAAGQAAMTVAPIASTAIFQYAGPRVTYGIAGAVAISALMATALAYHTMVPWKDYDDAGDDDNDDDDGALDDERRPLFTKATSIEL